MLQLSNIPEPEIFLWHDEIPADYLGRIWDCEYCATPLHYIDWGDSWDQPFALDTMHRCPLCGWYARHHNFRTTAGDMDSQVPVLHNFDLNATDVTLEELGTYLRFRYRDISVLTPRRFEELVADIFKNHGFDLCLTQQTRDQGADILVFEGPNRNIAAIIECKKYRTESKVGVAAIRTLVGACVYPWRVRRALLVTTSSFSPIAISYAEECSTVGLDVDLVAASELLTMLKVYNERLPLLHELSASDRAEIIRVNLEKFENDAKNVTSPGPAVTSTQAVPQQNTHAVIAARPRQRTWYDDPN